MNKYIIKKEKEQIDIQASKQTKNKNHQYVRAWKPTFASSILESCGHSNIYIFFIFFFKLMETGVNGASGALAQRHANMGNNIENENATRQLQNMGGRNALDNLLKPNLATKKCRVQVSISELRKNKLHSPVRNDSLLMQEQI